MEFTRETVTIPKVMKALAEKGIKEIDFDEVTPYQEKIVAEDKESKIKEYWDKHPVIWFISREVFRYAVLFSFFASVLFRLQPVAFVCATLFIPIVFYNRTKIERMILGRDWQKFPFQYFRSEYNEQGRFIAYDVCSCYKPGNTVCKCISPNILLNVEWHEASNVRFLVASNPGNLEEDEYCVDYWEKV
jgi:hypothetical protein